jgi:ribose/xylose/arabinose/galactoside ABC-type transport system permease subunit
MTSDWGGRVRTEPTAIIGDNPSAVRAAERERSLPSTASALAGDLTGVLVIVALALLFGLTTPYFLTLDNALNILRQMSVIGVVGIGATLVILIGGIDLSVGSVVLLTGGITGTLILNYDVNPWLAIVAGLGAAALVGLVNGTLVELLQISPVIVTLGTLIAVRGLGQAILWLNNSWVYVEDPLFTTLAAGRWLFLPISAALMFALYLLIAVVMTQTSFGRAVYAIGNNPRAAALCGLPVTRIKILVYVLGGLFAGIGGLLTAARTGVVNPTAGLGLEFAVITAVVLGGTSLRGGIGRVEKTLVGTAILTMVLNYLTIRGVLDTWQTAVTGLLILAAVVLDRVLRRGREE